VRSEACSMRGDQTALSCPLFQFGGLPSSVDCHRGETSARAGRPTTATNAHVCDNHGDQEEDDGTSVFFVPTCSIAANENAAARAQKCCRDIFSTSSKALITIPLVELLERLRLQAEEAHPPDVRNGRPSAGYSNALVALRIVRPSEPGGWLPRVERRGCLRVRPPRWAGGQRVLVGSSQRSSSRHRRLAIRCDV
jgi:hypothetical protein